MHKCVDSRLGRFEVVRELGRGLNSTVYLAFDPEIERQVVLKLLSAGVIGADKSTDRVRSVSQLSHIGIARLYDLDYETGGAYLVREYVEGESLEAVLARGSLNQNVALRLTQEVLDALAYAHAQGVCHHNLKPSNLILTPDNHLKITDFGSSKSGSVSAFMAPEQLKEKGDARSDLFSVGVILYLMLSGYRPFQGNSDATIEFKLVHQHPVPVAAMNMELSPEVDVVVARLLAKNPEERYQSAKEAKEAILGIVEDEDVGRVPGELIHSPIAVLAADLIQKEQPGLSRAQIRSYGGMWWKAGIAASVALAIALGAVEIGRRLRSVDPPSLTSRLTVPPEALKRTPKEPVKVKTLRKPRLVVGSGAQQTIKTVPVPIELRQPFKTCQMTIWADGRVVYRNTIRAEKKSRFLHMGSSNAQYLTMVQMPEGSHSVKIQINADQKYQQSGTVSAKFSQNESSKLVITSEKSDQPLVIELN